MHISYTYTGEYIHLLLLFGWWFSLLKDPSIYVSWLWWSSWGISIPFSFSFEIIIWLRFSLPFSPSKLSFSHYHSHQWPQYFNNCFNMCICINIYSVYRMLRQNKAKLNLISSFKCEEIHLIFYITKQALQISVTKEVNAQLYNAGNNNDEL